MCCNTDSYLEYGHLRFEILLYKFGTNQVELVSCQIDSTSIEKNKCCCGIGASEVKRGSKCEARKVMAGQYMELEEVSLYKINKSKLIMDTLCGLSKLYN